MVKSKIVSHIFIYSFGADFDFQRISYQPANRDIRSRLCFKNKNIYDTDRRHLIRTWNAKFRHYVLRKMVIRLPKTHTQKIDNLKNTIRHIAEWVILI